jgi:hypothetical protein
MIITLDSILQNFESNLWGYHLVVSAVALKPLNLGKNKRVLCTLNNHLTIHSGLMPLGDGDCYILINKEVRQKLKLELGDMVALKIEEDKSEFGMEMPEELSALLEQDEYGATFFNALTPGKKRTLIHLVLSKKQTDTRIKFALKMMEHLKLMEGKLDFKSLYESFKN